MESLHPTTGRALRIAFGGVILAFAWLALSVLFGFGAGHAHADDTDDRGGLLSGVTNTAGSLATSVADIVSDTAAAATDVVANTTSAATTAVTPAVEKVADIAPALPVAPVLDAAGSVTTAVSEVTGGGVVTPIVTTVVDVVVAVPVVGSVISGLQLDTAATTLGTSVDNTLHGTTAALDGVVSGVAEVAPGAGVTLPSIPLVPGVPLVSGTAIDDEAALLIPLPFFSSAAVATPIAAVHTPSTAHARHPTALSDVASAMATTAVTAIAVAAGGAWDGAGMILGSFAPANSALSGSGGAGPGAWALVAFVLFIAYRAWMRRSGPSNDTAPAAPTFSTDVSPD